MPRSLEIVALAADARAKRAGLDYWPAVDKVFHSSEAEYLQATEQEPFDATIIFSKAEKYGSESLHSFDLETVTAALKAKQSGVSTKGLRLALAFGSETAGVTFLEQSNAGRHILETSRMVFLPMHPSIRSQNLANTAAIALYEISRQAGNLPALEATTAKRSVDHGIKRT